MKVRVGLPFTRSSSLVYSTNRSPTSNGNDDDNDVQQGSLEAFADVFAASRCASFDTLQIVVVLNTGSHTRHGNSRSFDSIPNPDCLSIPVSSNQTYFSGTNSSTWAHTNRSSTLSSSTSPSLTCSRTYFGYFARSATIWSLISIRMTMR